MTNQDMHAEIYVSKRSIVLDFMFLLSLSFSTYFMFDLIGGQEIYFLLILGICFLCTVYSLIKKIHHKIHLINNNLFILGLNTSGLVYRGSYTIYNLFWKDIHEIIPTSFFGGNKITIKYLTTNGNLNHMYFSRIFSFFANDNYIELTIRMADFEGRNKDIFNLIYETWKNENLSEEDSI